MDYETMSKEQLETEYKNNYKIRKQIGEAWKDKVSLRYRFNHTPDGKPLTVTWSFYAILVTMTIVLLLVVVPAVRDGSLGSAINGYGQLENNHEYACPNGDWAGNTTGMIEHPDGYGGVYLYCPIDGKLIGHMGFRQAVV